MRARNLKPGFFKNEELATLEPLVRILFAGLWGLADREGRLEDRPARIKAEVLPYDECDVEAMLDALVHKHFIIRYTVTTPASNSYIAIPTFLSHQNPHHRETASKIPAPGVKRKPRSGPRLAQGKPQASPGKASEKARPSRAESLFSESGILTEDTGVPISSGRGRPRPSEKDDFADVEFEEDEAAETPEKPRPPDQERDDSAGSRKTRGPDPAGERPNDLVAYLIDYARKVGFALTDQKKGHFARRIGELCKTGVDPPLLRQAIRVAIEENKNPKDLVDVVNDLKGGRRAGAGRTAGDRTRRSGRSDGTRF